MWLTSSELNSRHSRINKCKLLWFTAFGYDFHLGLKTWSSSQKFFMKFLKLDHSSKLKLLMENFVTWWNMWFWMWFWNGSKLISISITCQNPEMAHFLVRKFWDISKFESFYHRIQFLFEFWAISEFWHVIDFSERFEFWAISKSHVNSIIWQMSFDGFLISGYLPYGIDWQTYSSQILTVNVCDHQKLFLHFANFSQE